MQAQFYVYREGFKFWVGSDGTGAVCKYYYDLGRGPDVTTIDGVPVTSIMERAFDMCHRLTSVTIPDSVNSIGSYAFWDCNSLTSVTIPNSVTTIGLEAFGGCWRLASLTIGNSVTTIEPYAFNDCAMSSITIPDSVTSIGRGAFEECWNLTSVTIGKSVTSIGDYVFYTCPNLASVTVGTSVTNIGVQAFACCTNLSNITIPNSVTSIGYGAFLFCTNLSNITIPNSVTNVGDYGFSACSRLTGVYFQGNAPSVGLDAFDGDNQATVYYLAGTTGWGPTFAGRPTVLWNPQVPFTYTTNNNTIIITGYTGSGGAVAIPSTIDGLPVTSIWPGAFASCRSLASPDFSRRRARVERIFWTTQACRRHTAIRTSFLFVFAVVFFEQMGLPLPAQPLLLAAGRFPSSGNSSCSWGLRARSWPA